MKVSTSLSLLLSSAAAIYAQSGEVSKDPKLGFTPGITYPDECRQKPDGDLCPPYLMNGNLIVTALNLHMDEENPDKPSSLFSSNTFRVGLGPAPAILEESTLSVFDFPGGMEGKNCTFHLITNFGDNVPDNTLYSVWKLKDNGNDVGMNTTWNTKPTREVVLGVAYTGMKTAVGFQKLTYGFVEGAGFGNKKLGRENFNVNSFKCPPAGKIVFETSQTAKIAQTLDSAGAINAGGNGGLCIEIENTPVFLARPV